MALKEFKDYPNTETPIDAKNLNFNFKEVFNLIFPIGKVEVFFDNEDHSNYMGFTWERTAVGKVLVGYDPSDTDFNAIGKTGGEKEHTLTIDEMPSHNHNAYLSGGSLASAAGRLLFETAAGQEFYNSIKSTGGDKPHNNLQPYEVVAYWKRIS